MVLRHAVLRLRRGWRSGELRVLTLALVVAIAAAGAVGQFTERVRGALAQQSGDALGGDLRYSARKPLPEALLGAVRASGARSTQVVSFSSVVFHGDESVLASVKAVADGYPLRGRLQTGTGPFDEPQPASGIPAPGEAWVDAQLWQALALRPGATLRLGDLDLKVRAVILGEPDRGNGFADLSPRLLVNAVDARASGLLGPYSRARYQLLVAGDAEAIGTLAALDPPEGVRRQTPRDARPEVRAALDRAGQFLDVAVLAVTLLSAAAVALSARHYGERLRDEIAVLKCLGARQRYLAQTLLLQLLLLGLAAAVLGGGAAWMAQSALAVLLGDLMHLALPPAPLLPLLSAALLGGGMLLGFAAPPLLDARRTPPLRVFQRNLAASRHSLGIWLAALLAGGALLWRATGDTRLALYVLGGAAGALLALGLLGALLVWALAPLRRRVGMSWRFGLGNLARRRMVTIAQVCALGLALLALLLVSVVRIDLLRSWQMQLPADTPNQFLIDIQPQQVEPLRAFLAVHGHPDVRFWPMARGRLVALNGKAVTADSFDDPATRRWINRDFNLSWTTTLNPDNRITAGRWWGEAGRGQPWLSAEDYAIERLGLKLGDTLTLDFAGEPVTLTVRNFRTVQWDSFRPNFFLLTPPGAVPAQVPVQWLTSFYLPAGQRGLLRQLNDAFPNVSVLDVDALLSQVRNVVARIVRAVEFIFAFTLLAGLSVLLAVIESSRDARVRETALLRALGARSGLLWRGLLAEYAVLGGMAGLVAAVAAQVLAWLLATQVFDIEYGLRPLLWLAGTLAGAGLVAGLGAWSLRPVLRTPPQAVLRGV